MRKKIIRKIAGCLLLACVYVPFIGFNIWKNGFSGTLFSVLLCAVIAVTLKLGVQLLCRTDGKEGKPEEDSYYITETIRMMRSIKNEKILRCIYIFVSDIVNEIKEDGEK